MLTLNEEVKNNIKVSVILPSLNVVNYIEECMDSLLNQSLKDLEIICVDAGSVDGTREILDRYAYEDQRITVLHSNMKSYGKQVNIGIEYATGEYVAILETDDWIEPDMYQCLYEYMLEDKLDYIAADFDKVYKLGNGSYYFVRQYVFNNERKSWYGKILDSNQITTLRTDDYVLWKGIYNRSFLNTYNIRLQETPGAAFQDMDFLQQVKTYAKKAKYIDRCFYHYRQGRAEASSYNLSGLQYYKNEFFWMNNQLKFNTILKDLHKKYYYYTMSIAFVGKYEEIIEKLNGNWKDKRLNEPYKWFEEQLVFAIKNNILNEDIYPHEMWRKLMLLLDSPEEYAELIMDNKRRLEHCVSEFQNMIGKHSVILFGCGIRGERLMLFCDQYRIEICAFCDNNPALQGKQKYGFPVLPPSVLKDEISSKDAVVLLSMKNGTEQVRAQLVEEGIEPGRIIDQLPAGIL